MGDGGRGDDRDYLPCSPCWLADCVACPDCICLECTWPAGLAKSRHEPCPACEDAPAGDTGLCNGCLRAADPWLGELGPIGGGS